MQATVIEITIADLAARGCHLDGPDGEPLTDDDVYGVRIVRVLDAGQRDGVDVHIYRYDLQTADAAGNWHSVPLDPGWTETLMAFFGA